MSRFALRLAALVAAAVLLLALAALGWCSWELHRPYAAWSGESIDLVLAPGLDAGSMMQSLHEAGVLHRPRLLRAWLSLRGGGESLQAGEYRFEGPVTPLALLERLRRGDVLLHAVTVPEGLSIEEIADQVAEAGLATREELILAFREPEPMRSLDPAAQDLEGYLFPDTYHFPSGVSARQIAAAMVERFLEVIGRSYVAEAEARGLSLREAVTLASMIERETSVPEERARISRVFHNRLGRGMRMQCDPTVIYALRRAGRRVERLYSKHLEFESPWNTYRVDGLPPGPIANPGRGSLDAAIRPSNGEDLYFVARPNGGHTFSDDLGSHRRAVAEWRDYVRSSR